MSPFTQFALCWLATLSLSHAAQFGFPTANRALLEPNGSDRFLVGTANKPWTSGGFGCVRSEGYQMHEGIDVRAIQRDRRGEPTDPVLATADGVVAYVNRKAALSNYGNYVVLRHRLDGFEVYSLYAHLSEARADLKPGLAVKAQEAIATMGRTTNTRQSITKDRAHVHFEVNLIVNDRYSAWHEKFLPGQRNDHGVWNGRNMLGLDPTALLMAQGTPSKPINLRQYIQNRPEMLRVAVRATNFPWLRRYAALVTPNPAAERAGIAGYELALDYSGIPFQITPRTAAEMKSRSRIALLSVNEPEQQAHPCRKLVTHRNGRWELTQHGTELLELLIF